MAITSPVGHGPLDVEVSFNESPPLNYSFPFEENIVFTPSAGLEREVYFQGEQHQILPEVEDLYGVALKPRYEHFHNFLYSYKTNDLVEDSIHIAGGLLDDGRNNLIQHFGWKVIEPWYHEFDEENLDYITPLIHGEDYTESASGSTSGLDSLEEKRQRGAKWSYKLQGIPVDSFALNGSSLVMILDKVSKLVPWQTQLQGNKNGPTGIGVHWGLEKEMTIPYGLGFYVDFYMEKRPDVPTNDKGFTQESSSTGEQEYKDVDIFDSYFQEALKSGGRNVGWSNDSIFSGDNADDKNSAFYLVNKTYIVLQIGNSPIDGNCFFLVISHDSHPKFFQVDGDKKVVTLLSEYNPNSGDKTTVPSGLKMLIGDGGSLRLQIRQIGRHILIENNVFAVPWVIPLPLFKANAGATAQTVSSAPDAPIDVTDGSVNLNRLGGTIKIYGGNLSCGVSFCHLNYYPSSTIYLKEKKVWGENRDFECKLSSWGANNMPVELKLMGADEKFYPNIAQTIDDSDGEVDLIDIPINYFGEYGGNVGQQSRLVMVPNIIATPVPKYTSAIPSIILTAGTGFSTEGEGFEYGNCITPVLQFCRIASPAEIISIESTPINIEDLVETIEITREAQDYHSVSASGSMTLNVFSPKANMDALREVIGSIGKARYLSITASHFGCAQSEFLTYRTTSGPSGNVVTGTSGGMPIFTGIAFNPAITEEAGKRYVKFELKDFWTILESKLIINSPYFDGALDVDVVDFLLKLSGLKEDHTNIYSGPPFDAMPVSFSFNQPNAKFDDKKTVAEAITELATKYSKYAFFDVWGNFCYYPLPQNLLVNFSGAYPTKFSFYSSHLGTNRNVVPQLGPYYPDVAGISGVPLHNSQVAYEVKTTQWNNKDIFNKIQIMSVDARTKSIILMGDVNYDSLTDPQSLGFLGYEKPFIQEEAAFGDVDRVRKILRYYTRMYRPIYTINWKCIGGNLGVDIFDMVSVDGALVVVTKISHTIDAKNNSWHTEYTGEWIYPPLDTGNIDLEVN